MLILELVPELREHYPTDAVIAKYTRGIHPGPNGTMLITTGLSNTGGVVPRLFNPREIVYIELET